ncbi:MAG: TRAP transporter large permease [Gammaproteobacteria bacterium]|nr:TRAP transporter large permease [Gammaproteobacteria bacterium]MDH3508223.1 TRAP transporter large permease [Gammaproteobacteria bacterium]
MAVAVFAFVALFLLLISAPVFIAILAPTLLTFELFGPPVPTMALTQQMMQGINKFSLLAIPLFMFAADIISRGEIGVRLLRLVETTVGHLYGGIAITTAVTCALFGAVSGIGQAAIVSIGPIVYPALIRQGYSRGFAAGLILSASTLAMLIPPGVAMILYSLSTTSSVGGVFLAGLSTGLVFMLFLAIYCYTYARVKRVGQQRRASWQERYVALRAAGWSLGLPVIIFGGIYAGTFTPTEAASGACMYALFVEMVVYRKLDLRGLSEATSRSSIVIASLLILLTAGSAMAYFLTLQGVPQIIAGAMGDTGATGFLLSVNLVFLITGMFIDPNSAIIVLTPLFHPIATALGIDPLHLGAVIVFNVAIGMITPPFGINLFVGMATFKLPFDEIAKSVLPFIGIALATLALISYVPIFATWLPRLVGN